MDYFKDKVAIVTGGASGIGQGLCEELSQRGAVVIVADINAEGAGRVASAITTTGGQARATRLDVSQAEDVQRLIEETALEHGQLDFMFNNAGIGMGGEVRDMDLAQWRRIVDINLWSVIYGTAAAYRVMIEQGVGHIVNTASLSGLVPGPMQTAYTTTKFAVVGLSTSLRAEAASLGVKVSVVCPGFIQTPIWDTGTRVTKINEDAFDNWLPRKMMDAADCARVILRGVARNKAIITVTAFARIWWWLYRLQPALVALLIRRAANDLRALCSEP